MTTGEGRRDEYGRRRCPPPAQGPGARPAARGPRRGPLAGRFGDLVGRRRASRPRRSSRRSPMLETGQVLSPVTAAVEPVVEPVVQATVAPIVETVVVPVVRTVQPVTAVLDPGGRARRAVRRRSTRCRPPSSRSSSRPCSRVRRPRRSRSVVRGSRPGRAGACFRRRTWPQARRRSTFRRRCPLTTSCRRPVPAFRPSCRHRRPSADRRPLSSRRPTCRRTVLPVGAAALSAAADDARNAAADRAFDPSFAPD